MKTRGHYPLSLLAVLVTGQLLSAIPVHAVDCVAFGSVQNPTSTELARFNIKLTYVAFDRRSAETVVLRKQGSAVDIGPSAFCRKSGIDYLRDAGDLVTCSLTGAEMQGVLDSLATIPDLTDGGRDRFDYVSVSIIDANGTASRVFDSVVEDSIAGVALKKIRQGLAANDSATSVLSALACQIGVGITSPGIDVTNQVVVKLSGVRYRRSDGRYLVKVKIQNTSSNTIAGPAVLALRLHGSATVVSPDGFLGCRANPAGAPFRRFLSGSSTLAPNASAEFEVQVANPLQQKIRPLRLRVVRGI
jgi:hypothetical protein